MTLQAFAWGFLAGTLLELAAVLVDRWIPSGRLFWIRYFSRAR